MKPVPEPGVDDAVGEVLWAAERAELGCRDDPRVVDVVERVVVLLDVRLVASRVG